MLNHILFSGVVSAAEEEIPCSPLWAPTWLEAAVWTLPGFHLISINHTENNVTCYSIGRTLVHQFEGCWRHLKVSRLRSSLSSRWGVLKNMECTSSVSFWTWGFQVSRGYFTDESTSEMLAKWTHMLCPADRSSFWINCNNHHDHNFVWVKVSEAEVNISFYVPIRIHIAT